MSPELLEARIERRVAQLKLLAITTALLYSEHCLPCPNRGAAGLARPTLLHPTSRRDGSPPQ
jgi:hypothetical protein